MPGTAYPNERRVWLPAAWLATLVLTFWVGAWWARPGEPSHAKASRAAVRTTPAETSEEKRSSLDPADPRQVAAGLERGAAEPGDYRKQAHLARVAAKLDLREVTAALDAEEARGPLDTRREVVEGLLARFAEIDPAAATVRGAQLQEKLDGYSSWIETPLAFWWRRDAHAAQVWASGLPSGYLRNGVRGDLAEFLIASDPEEALRQGLAQSNSPLSFNDVADLFASLAKNDLARAAESARAVPRSANQDSAVEGVLKVWVARDPAAAYAWATTTAQVHSERANDLDHFYHLWSEQDAPAAAAWALGHELASDKQGDWNYGFNQIISHLTDRDPGTAQGFVARLPAWAQKEAREELCRNWEEKNPAAAADYALSFGGTGEGGANKMVLHCLESWAGNNLEGARAWVEQMPPGKARGDAMDKVCEKWCKADPRGCADYLLTHQQQSDEPLAKYGGFQNAVGVWAEEKPDEMLLWSQGLPDADVRDAALKEGARRLASDDPAKTAQMVAAISLAGRGDAVKKVVENMQGHFTETAALVETLPNDKTAVEATKTFADQWGEKDAAAAAAWVAARPAGSARDAAAKEVVYWVMKKQGVAAAEQTVALVQDPKQKAEASESMANAYLDKDRAGAKAWVASSPLFNPKQRAKWLREAEKNGDEEDDADD